MTFANGPDFKRLDSLPRRELVLPSIELVAAVSRQLRLRPDDVCDQAFAMRKDGTLKGCAHCMLRNIQVAALLEVLQFGGYFPIRPGAGKTHISFLIPTVRGKTQPVLLVPAAMRESTRIKYTDASQHWRISPWLYIESYETVSRQENRLKELKPDCLILDESHKVKNKKAGVTLRVTRCVAENPSLEVYGMTGTSIRKSYSNPAHVAQYCLGLNNPYPNDARVVGMWAREVDPPKESEALIEVGALAKWVGQIGKVPVRDIRGALRRRIVETPGIVATSDEGPECGLIVSSWDCGEAPEIASFIHDVQEYGQLPDGKDIIDHIRMHDVIMQAVCGYYLDWVVAPPKYWMHARRLWFRLVRHYIQHYPVDTVDHVVREMNAGRLRDRNAAEFMRMLRTEPEEWDVPPDVNIREWWHVVQPTFTPVSRVNWISAQPLEQVAKWCKEHPRGLVWCRNPCFGEMLETHFGVPYYGAGGLNKKRQHIENHHKLPNHGAACASIVANCEGKNLQFAWHESLLLQPSTGHNAGAEMEQMIARIHRDLQPADDVWQYVNVTYSVLLEAYRRTKNQAVFHEEISGQPQRLCMATDLILGDSKWHS